MHKKNFLLLFCLVMTITGMAQSYYTTFGGSDSVFNSRYKMIVVFDEKNGILNISGDAPIMNVKLTGYTKAQLAARKGSEHNKYFPAKVRKFSYNMKVPGLQDRYYYWLKIYTEDGTLQEYVYKRKDDAPAVDEKAQEHSSPESVDETEASGYEFWDKDMRNMASGKIKPTTGTPATIIKTNITCAAGKIRIINALKEMDGVTKVFIDIKTGKLSLSYSSDGTSYQTILDTITAYGFTAGGQAAKEGIENPCITKK